MAEQVAGGVHLAGVVSDVKDLVLDEVAPGAPLAWVRGIHLEAGDGGFGRFVNVGDFGEDLSGGEGELVGFFDGREVVAEGGVDEWALDGEGGQVGLKGAVAEYPGGLRIGDVSGEFTDAQKAGVGAFPEVFVSQAVERDGEFAVGFVPGVDEGAQGGHLFRYSRFAALAVSI